MGINCRVAESALSFRGPHEHLKPKAFSMRWLLILLAVIAVALASLRTETRAFETGGGAEAVDGSDKPATQSGVDADGRSDDSEDEADPHRYVRVKEDESGRPQTMQTAVVRFVGKPGSPYAGRVVDLVGVVHIGQLDYYEKLNRRLGGYDRVLYELVAPDGTRFTPEDLQERTSVLSSMQSGMKDLLNLEYQLEKVDYMAKNFRHADMSPEEFAEDFERRGDSVWKMVARMMGAGLATQANTGGDAGLLLAMFSRDRPKKMKQVMAKQLVDMETITAGISDADGNNTLIKGRNAKAFRILREELDAGHQELAVFYGAGHLPDMAERLEREFEMREVETAWLDAWDLTRN